MSDDFTRDTSTTGVVSVGAGATGVIETRGDIDWFEVTLQASRTYRLTWRGYRPAPATMTAAKGRTAASILYQPSRGPILLLPAPLLRTPALTGCPRRNRGQTTFFFSFPEKTWSVPYFFTLPPY